MTRRPESQAVLNQGKDVTGRDIDGLEPLAITLLPQTLRTPDERFANLPGYPFAPHYVSDLDGYQGLQVHYLDEGPRDAAKVFLCLHGQPTWSYLYRRMLPVFTAAGHRVVAPDLLGFGKSDKPVEDSRYTFTFHRELLLNLVEHLELENVVLVVQDWGGLLGLTLPMDMPDRFSGLLIMDTAFATGDIPLGEAFLQWRAYNNNHPDLPVGRLLASSCPQLSPAEAAAYDAPFPDKTYKSGVRRFPNLVPEHPDAEGAELSRRAREWLHTEWAGKTFMAIGMKDPFLGPSVMHTVAKFIRDCPLAYEVAEGGNFLQEWGVDIARRALDVL